MEIDGIHHVSLPVTDLDRPQTEYLAVEPQRTIEILGLRAIERPPFDFPGAWFQVGRAAAVRLSGSVVPGRRESASSPRGRAAHVSRVEGRRLSRHPFRRS